MSSQQARALQGLIECDDDDAEMCLRKSEALNLSER